MASPNKAKPAGQKPVTAHPLFPAIVALWFAALLGIGSMVLPQALYDKLGVAMGLGSLGLSARLGMAVVAGVIGGALGMVLARKAAATQTTGQPRTRSAAVPAPTNSATKRPISAMEELGSDRLDEPLAHTGPEPFTGRRRALAVTDESGPSEYLAQVPLPGGEATLDLMGAELLDEEEALELGHYDAPRREEPASFVRTEVAPPARQMFQPPVAEPAPEPDLPIRPYESFEPDWSTESPMPTAPAPFASEADAAPFAAPVATAPRPFAPPPPLTGQAAPFAAPYTAAPAPEPAPEPAPAMQAAAFSMPFPAQSATAAPVATPVQAPVSFERADAAQQPTTLAAAARPVFAPFSLPQAAPQAERTPSLHEGASLSALALSDLIDRFAQALHKADPASLTEGVPVGLRRFAPVPDNGTPFAGPDTAAAPAMPFTPAPFASEPAPAPVADVPVAPPPAPEPFTLTSVPAALRPIGYDDHDEGHDDNDDGDELFGHPFALTMPTEPNRFAIPAAPFGLPQAADPAEAGSTQEEAVDEAEQEDAFGSLLAMKSGFGPGKEFVRVEDEPEDSMGIEPVVVFPGMATPGRAAPAPDGPSRDPADADPPFAAPPFAQPAFARAPFGQPQAAPAGQPGALDRNATEQALRDALAKLQQMSGAA